MKIKARKKQNKAGSTEIEALVTATIREFIECDLNTTPSKWTIYGDGRMDSMGLVIFLAELEERLAELLGMDLVLANEKAMSRTKSPYLDVRSLTAFIVELADESVEK